MPALTRIQLRRGAAAEWTNQVLYAGEIGLETDTGKFKIGDGSTVWSSLGYSSILPSELNELVDDRVANLLVAGSNISLTYDDNANTLTIATDGLDTEQVEDIIGTKIIGGSNISVSYDDTSGNTTISVTGVSLSGHTHVLTDVTDVTSTAAEVNLLDGSIANTIVNSKAVIYGSSGEISANLIVVDSISIDGNTISTSANANLVLAPNGTGDVHVDADTLRVGDSNTNAVITTNGAGNLIIHTNGGTNGGNITLFQGSNSNIEINPNGTGDVLVNADTLRVGDSGSQTTITTNGTGDLVLNTNGGTGASNITVVNSGNIVLNSNADIIVNAGAVSSEIVLNGGSVVVGQLLTDGIITSQSNRNLNITTDGTGHLILHTNSGTTSGIIEIEDSITGNVKITSQNYIVLTAAETTTSGNLTVGGNLIVNGNTTTVNSTVTTIDDPILTLGGDTAPISDDNKDRGIEFRYYSGSAKIGFFGYDDSTGKLTFIPDATNTSEVFSGTTGEIDAKIDWSNVNNKPDPVVTVTLEGDVTGTANTTLTDLASGTITVNTTIAANSVALGSDTTGNYVAGVSAGSYATVSGSGSENATVTVGVDATDANTASKVVARDASGNFSAGTITATLSGTATNALNIEVDASSSNINPIVFVNGTDGNLKPSVNNNLRFDAANNELLGDDATTPTTSLKYFIIDGGTP